MIAKHIATTVQTLVLCQNSLLRIVILCASLNRNLLFKRIRNIVDIVDFNMQFAVLIFFRILQNDSIRLVFVFFQNPKQKPRCRDLKQAYTERRKICLKYRHDSDPKSVFLRHVNTIGKRPFFCGNAEVFSVFLRQDLVLPINERKRTFIFITLSLRIKL